MQKLIKVGLLSTFLSGMAFANSATYFGLWASSIDPGNRIEFFNGNTSIGLFRIADLVPGGYNGNPNANFAGQNANERYAFINFQSDTAFTTVGLYGGQGTVEIDFYDVDVELPFGLVARIPDGGAWSTSVCASFNAPNFACDSRLFAPNVSTK